MQIGKLRVDLFYVLMIVIFVIMCCGSIFLAHHIGNKIEEAGGARQIIIDIGKDVKEIAKEIEED
jgi:cell division protein YceG involved in septum cleavage